MFWSSYMSISFSSGSWKSGNVPSPQDLCEWLCHMTMQWTYAKTLSEGNSARLKFETIFSLVSSYVVNAQKFCPVLPWNPFFNCLKIKLWQANLTDAPYFSLAYIGDKTLKGSLIALGSDQVWVDFCLIWWNIPRVECNCSWHGP